MKREPSGSKYEVVLDTNPLSPPQSPSVWDCWDQERYFITNILVVAYEILALVVGEILLSLSTAWEWATSESPTPTVETPNEIEDVEMPMIEELEEVEEESEEEIEQEPYRELTITTCNRGHVLAFSSIDDLLDCWEVKCDDCFTSMIFYDDIARLESTDIQVNFSSIGLTRIPQISNQLDSILEIDLRRNNLTELPESLCRLRHLEVILLDRNHIETISPAIGDMQQLTHLSLARNKLSAIPYQISYCEKLTHLNLSRNQIRRVPEALYFKQFVSLNLSHNTIYSFPYFAGKKLNISFNRLVAPPTVIPLFPLSEVRLNLKANRISYLLNREAASLKQLCSFDISDNLCSK